MSTRLDGEAAASAKEVDAAIRAVATGLGMPPERLLMVDYQQQSLVDADLPQLNAVFAVYGSWKRARRAAAQNLVRSSRRR